MPAAKSTAADTSADTTAAPAAAAPAPASAPAPAVASGVAKMLSKAAEASLYEGDSVKASALNALNPRLDEVLNALPDALAVADGDLKTALTALSTLLI